MMKLTKKAIELLDAVTSVPYSRKGLGSIGRGLDAALSFTCYSYWLSCYFDQRGKLMKALHQVRSSCTRRQLYYRVLPCFFLSKSHYVTAVL
jgi:hypothetical protein